MSKSLIPLCIVLLILGPAWASETWTAYSNTNEVNDLFIHGEEVLAGTTGGLVRWDIASGFFSKTTSLDGLGGNNVKCVEIAPDASTWVGTGNGLSIHDGNVWRTFTDAHGLGGNEVWDVDFATDGSVWLATVGSSWSENGPTFFDWETITVYTVADGLSSSGGTAQIAIAPDGHVWFSAPAGLDKFDGIGFTKHEFSLNWIQDIAFGPDGEVWCITESALYHRDGEAFSEMKGPDDMSMCGYSLAFGDAGLLWIGRSDWSDPDGLWSFDGEKWEHWDEADGLCNNKVNSIAVAEDGALWLGTDGGVSRFDGVDFRTYATQNILVSNDVQCMAALHTGGLAYWTPSGSGLYDGETWSSIMGGPGASRGGRVADIAEDFFGNIWLATDQGAHRFNGQQWASFWSELPNPSVTCIAAGRDVSVWFGTKGGICRFDGTDWQSWTEEDGIADDDVYSIAVAPDGLTWFGVGSQGLMSFDGESSFVHYPSGVVGDYFIRSIAFDSESNLWIPTGDGIRMFDGATWTAFCEASGFPAKSAWNIAIDRDDVKWVSVRDDTGAAGVCSFDDAVWKHYTISDGLLSNSIRDIVGGLDGSVWFATDCGISRLQVMAGQWPEITLQTDSEVYSQGQRISASISCVNRAGDFEVDLWIALLEPDGSLVVWPPSPEPAPFWSGTIPAGLVFGPFEFASIDLDASWLSGDYTWLAAIFHRDTPDQIGEIAEADWCLN